MKKALIGMAFATLAFSSANAVPLTAESGTSFETIQLGKMFTSTDDDYGTGVTQYPAYWFTTSNTNDLGVVTNFTSLGEIPGGIARPAKWAASANNQCLFLDINNGKALRSPNVVDGVPDKVDIGNGLYFDSMVYFTSTDTPPEPELGVDKIVVWLYASDRADDAFGIKTNLVVTAGYLPLNGDPVAVNYLASNNWSLEPNSWHRLTIKAIDKISDNQPSLGYGTLPGFVVFIDGVAVTCADARGDAGTIVDSLTAKAAGWAAQNALFPSLHIDGDGNNTTITAVGFTGTGAIDDLVFTTTAPDFAADGISCTLTWPAVGSGVASVEYSLDNGTTWTTATADEAIALADAGDILVKATYAPNYVAGTWKVNGSEYTPVVVGEAYKITVDSPTTVEVVAKQNLVEYDGVPYESIAAALTALENAQAPEATFKLLADASAGVEGLLVSEGLSLTLDLAGHSLVAHEDAPAIWIYGGTVTITNSTPTVGAVVADQASAIFGDGGFLYVTAGRIEGLVDSDDQGDFGMFTQCALTGGSYSPEGDTATFYLAESVVAGYEATYADGYWTVRPAGYVPTFTVTLTQGTGTTLTTSDPLTDLAAGDTVTITAALENEYYKDLVVTVDGTPVELVGGQYTVTLTDSNIAIASSATALASYAVSLTAANATVTGVADGDTVYEGQTISFTVAADADYELTGVTVNGVAVEPSESTYVYVVLGTEEAIAIVVSTRSTGGGEVEWPSAWNNNNDAGLLNDFRAWVAAGNDPTDPNAEEAFLLGASLQGFQKLAVTAITVADGKVTIDTNQEDLTNAKGTLFVLVGSTLDAFKPGAATPATKTAVAVGTTDTSTLVDIDGSADAKFFQIGVSYPVLAQP